MTSSTGRIWVGFLVGLAVAGARAGVALPPTPGDDGLARFVPKDAGVFIERRGHAAVREAMLASNFGAMASDETMLKFFHDSRVRIGKQIVKELFDLKEPQEIVARQKQLHEVLIPFWDQPAAFCTVGQKEHSSTSSIFLCATGAYKASCRKALEELMKIDVPAEGVAGTRQAFTYRKGEVLWKGLLKRREPFLLPKAPDERAAALGNGSVFMVCWVDDLLVATTGVGGADAMSGMLSVTAPEASLAADKAFQAVAARTSIKDWAFRWHVSVPAMMGDNSGEGEVRQREMPQEMKTWGLDRVLAVGGSEGYADKLVTRRLLVYAPQADLSMRLIRPGGSYRRGLAMAPRGAMMSLSGEIDTGVLTKLIAATSSPRDQKPEEGPASRPASAPANPVGEAVSRLVLAGDGNASAFVPAGIPSGSCSMRRFPPRPFRPSSNWSGLCPLRKRARRRTGAFRRRKSPPALRPPPSRGPTAARRSIARGAPRSSS
ncbi:MAG: hypothetical protein NTV86_06850 [Planctomycetota bacterium]|nr:hypothetical protein [Planctomycetota bacterium]